MPLTGHRKSDGSMENIQVVIIVCY